MPDPAAVFAAIVARTDDNLTATETLGVELDHTDATPRLRQIHTEPVHDLAATRAAYLLGRALPAVHEASMVASPHYRDLLTTVAAAHADGLDTGVLVTAITTTGVDQPTAIPVLDPGTDPDAVPDTLTGARDTAAVLRARADGWIAAHTPHPASVQAGVQRPGGFRAVRDLPTPTGLVPTPPRHPGAGTTLADHTTALGERIARLEAAAEAGRAQQADAGLVAQMRAQRVRLRPDRDLDQVVLALRTRLSNARMDALLGPAPPRSGRPPPPPATTRCAPRPPPRRRRWPLGRCRSRRNRCSPPPSGSTAWWWRSGSGPRRCGCCAAASSTVSSPRPVPAVTTGRGRGHRA